MRAFERAKERRDRTAASLAAKESAREKKPQKLSSHKADKEAKKMQRDDEEMSALAADVAKRHTTGNFYPSIAFLILYRILAAEYAGKVVALLPFQPFNFLQKITFRGMSTVAVKDVHALWVESGSVSPDVSSASQACAFAFIYCLCSLSVKMMVNMAFGTKPPPGADQGVGTLIESPQSQKMMKKFGLDAEDVKEARRTVGY